MRISLSVSVSMNEKHICTMISSEWKSLDGTACGALPIAIVIAMPSPENLPDFKGMHMVADIGNGTMNVI